MGIRETLNNNPAITTGATLLIIVFAIAFIIYSSTGGGTPKPPTKAYFTVDDGKTWFPDDITLIPPFDKDGKQAVRAHIFSCKGGDEPFVAYLERHTPEAKATLEKYRANPDQAPPDGMLIADTGTEVKKPGVGNWVSMANYQKYAEITNINCPDGKLENLVPVLPD